MCNDKDCPLPHCYNKDCRKHLAPGFDSWLCTEECRKAYWGENYIKPGEQPKSAKEVLLTKVNKLKYEKHITTPEEEAILEIFSS